jgi:hypothetical protein
MADEASLRCQPEELYPVASVANEPVGGESENGINPTAPEIFEHALVRGSRLARPGGPVIVLVRNADDLPTQIGSHLPADRLLAANAEVVVCGGDT